MQEERGTIGTNCLFKMSFIAFVVLMLIPSSRDSRLNASMETSTIGECATLSFGQ